MDSADNLTTFAFQRHTPTWTTNSTMRVLDAHTQQLVDLPAGEKYAILSHTWETKEVIFQDMNDAATARR